MPYVATFYTGQNGPGRPLSKIIIEHKSDIKNSNAQKPVIDAQSVELCPILSDFSLSWCVY